LISRLRAASGFTLIEILVVIFIISIVSGVVLISISPNRNKELETFTKDLTELMVFAEEQALLKPDILMMSFQNRYFTFLRYQAPKDEETNNTWIAVDSKILGKHYIPDFIQVRLNIRDAADEEDADKHQIIISSNGDVTPFTIYIGARGEKPRYAIMGEADGSITYKLLQ